MTEDRKPHSDEILDELLTVTDEAVLDALKAKVNLDGGWVAIQKGQQATSELLLGSRNEPSVDPLPTFEELKELLRDATLEELEELLRDMRARRANRPTTNDDDHGFQARDTSYLPPASPGHTGSFSSPASGNRIAASGGIGASPGGGVTGPGTFGGEGPGSGLRTDLAGLGGPVIGPGAGSLGGGPHGGGPTGGVGGVMGGAGGSAGAGSAQGAAGRPGMVGASMGAGAGHGEEERERSTWLTEDEDVWSNDDIAPPPL